MTKDSFIQAVQLIWIQGGSLTDKRIRTLNLLNQYEAETEQLYKPDVVRSLPDFKFTEWLGETYIRLNQVWVHRYSSQLHKENWKTTEELYELYLKQQGQ
jgi:hypothetical protein